MDETTRLAIQAAAATLMGYIWQWVRGPQKIPNWLSWLMFGVAAGLLYLWQTPGLQAADWRVVALGLYMFVLASRGAASTSSDAKVAPKTNTI